MKLKYIILVKSEYVADTQIPNLIEHPNHITVENEKQTDVDWDALRQESRGILDIKKPLYLGAVISSSKQEAIDLASNQHDIHPFLIEAVEIDTATSNYPKTFSVTESFVPTFGSTFFSEFFACDCIVTYYHDQREWYFVTKKSPLKILRAKAFPTELQWYF